MEPNRCYGCMNLKTGSPFCEHCGYDERTVNPSHTLRAGTVLREKYLIGKVLGQGGFGITYLGWDVDLNIPVAIKEYFPTGVVMRESTTSQTVSVVTGNEDNRYLENRNRFLREAQTLARLEDVPEVVQIKNYFSANNTAYIVMGFVKGITLKEHIRRSGGRLSAEETLGLLRPLLKALAQVHALGLVHRDISPDNIMLQPNGKVRLIDFGAAHESFSASGGRSTQAVLKHGFAPVEQYQSKGNLGPWTDVYAMCATIYYCLTGSLPPQATDRMMGEDAFDWEGLPGLTWQQKTTLQRGLEIHYGSRISSMKELFDGLFRETGIPPQPPQPPQTPAAGGTYQPSQTPRTPAAGGTYQPSQTPRAPVSGGTYQPSQPGRTAPQPKPKKKSPVGIIVALVLVAVIGLGFFLFRDMLPSSGSSLRDATGSDSGNTSSSKAVDVETDLTGLRLDGKASGKTGKDYSATLIPEDGYALPEAITVKVDGSKLSDKKYDYDPATGELTIPGEEITGDIKIQAEAETISLVGEWAGTVDLTDLINESLGSDPDMVKYFTFHDLSLTLELEFTESVCRMTVDSTSVQVLADQLQQQMLDGLYAMLEDMIAEEGLDMTVDEMLDAMGYTSDSLIEELFPVDDIVNELTDLSVNGSYLAEDGLLYIADSVSADPRTVDPNPYTLTGDTLIIQATGNESADEAFMYPLNLHRVG